MDPQNSSPFDPRLEMTTSESQPEQQFQNPSENDSPHMVQPILGGPSGAQKVPATEIKTESKNKSRPRRVHWDPSTVPEVTKKKSAPKSKPRSRSQTKQETAKRPRTRSQTRQKSQSSRSRSESKKSGKKR
jgi:hypothetical protein